jgi:hypothetical protein
MLLNRKKPSQVKPPLPAHRLAALLLLLLLLASSYKGVHGISGRRCAQLSSAHTYGAALSTTCSAHECRDTGEVFSAE